MDRITRILPLLVGVSKVRKVRCKGIAVEKKWVIAINSTNGIIDPVVEFDNSCLARIRGFVEGIVPRNPFVIFVVLRKFRP